MRTLRRFPDVPEPDDLRATLLDDGAAIVERGVDPEIIDRVASQCEDWFARTPNGEGAFFGRRTRRFGGVLAKAPAAGDLVIADPILSVIDAILRDPDNATGAARADCIQLNLVQAIAIGPGEGEQILHRDDALFPIAPGFELMANVMWALDEFTAANGATRVVPGSHRWPRDRRAAPHEVVHAVMPKGGALVWLGGLIHGGGANRTGAPRRGLTVSYNLGWLAQTEKLLLTVPPEIARSAPERLQRLIGYQIHRPNLGWIEGRDPVEWLHGEIGSTAATHDNLTPAMSAALSSLRSDLVEGIA